MKPFRIFIFYAAVMLLLFVMAFFIPEKGIRIGGEMRFTFLRLPDLNRTDTISSEVDVEKLLSRSMVTEDPETDPSKSLFLPSDGIHLNTKPVFAPANSDSLQNSVFRIQFAREAVTCLIPFSKVWRM